MKICNKCNKEKDEKEFRRVGKYYRNTCLFCENEESKLLVDITKDYVDNKKVCCSKCGYDKCINALDFHHINSTEKEYSLCVLRKRKWSVHTKELIDKELEKCIVLCATCHREIHSI